MNLFDRAIQDAKLFTNRDFSVSMDIVAPTDEAVTINGWTSKHHTAFDTEGNMMNSKQVHVTISEGDLSDAGYPYRDSNGEVYMKNHKVTVKDSTQNTSVYIVSQWFPDERLGLIVLILKDFR